MTLFDLFEFTEEQRATLNFAATRRIPLFLVTPSSPAGPMAARRLTQLMPPMDGDAMAAVAQVYRDQRLPAPRGRPFRAPHHTVSDAGLSSELSLAKHGVMLLDDAAHWNDWQVELAAQRCSFSATLLVMTGSVVPAAWKWLVVQLPAMQPPANGVLPPPVANPTTWFTFTLGFDGEGTDGRTVQHILGVLGRRASDSGILVRYTHPYVSPEPRNFRVFDIVPHPDDDGMYLRGGWYFEATDTEGAECDVPIAGSTVVVY